MSNIIDANGITVKTRTEIISDLVAGFKAAYGDDINVDQDTPDGQAINVMALAVSDTLDLITQVYNSFDPDLAFGRTLDQRAAINGIQRQAGTHTTTSILITTDRTVSLKGLDGLDPVQADSTIFAVSDALGNIFYLTNSVNLPNGATDAMFTAAEPGAVQVGVINSISTITLGVKTVINSTVQNTTLGLDEETDAQLRLRRQKSVSLASQGYIESLIAELRNISGVSYANVYENTTSAADSDGVPGHGIWVVVDGGTDSAIGYAIYTKRPAGVAMKGSEIYAVSRPDGSLFEIRFDRASTESLHVKFTAQSISGVALDQTYIKNQLVALVSLDVAESINVNDIAALIKEIDPNCLATNIQVSNDGAIWVSILPTSAKNKRLTLVSGNITIT